MIPIVQIIKTNSAILPKRSHPSDGAVDLHAYITFPITLAFGEQVLVDTGIKVNLPSTEKEDFNWCFNITPRSGLANKHGITVTNSPGLIDQGYNGNIMVIVKNTKMAKFIIEPDMRIAQMKLSKSYKFTWYQVFEFTHNSDRGEKGFGSTDNG